MSRPRYDQRRPLSKDPYDHRGSGANHSPQGLLCYRVNEKDQGQNDPHADLENPEDPPVVPGEQVHRRLAVRKVEMGQLVEKNHDQEDKNYAGEKPTERKDQFVLNDPPGELEGHYCGQDDQRCSGGKGRRKKLEGLDGREEDLPVPDQPENGTSPQMAGEGPEGV